MLIYAHENVIATRKFTLDSMAGTILAMEGKNEALTSRLEEKEQELVSCWARMEEKDKAISRFAESISGIANQNAISVSQEAAASLQHTEIFAEEIAKLAADNASLHHELARAKDNYQRLASEQTSTQQRLTSTLHNIDELQNSTAWKFSQIIASVKNMPVAQTAYQLWRRRSLVPVSMPINEQQKHEPTPVTEHRKSYNPWDSLNRLNPIPVYVLSRI